MISSATRQQPLTTDLSACNGEPEVISNKSSNNIYRKNYFEDCDGELVMRGGHDCVIDSNVIKGGNSGIRVDRFFRSTPFVPTLRNQHKQIVLLAWNASARHRFAVDPWEVRTKVFQVPLKAMLRIPCVR